jgi:hypothetical protein
MLTTHPTLVTTIVTLVWALVAAGCLCAALSELWIRRRATADAVAGAVLASVLWPATLLVIALWAALARSGPAERSASAEAG